VIVVVVVMAKASKNKSLLLSLPIIPKYLIKDVDPLLNGSLLFKYYYFPQVWVSFFQDKNISLIEPTNVSL